MKFPRFRKRRVTVLQEELDAKDQTIAQLRQEVEEKTSLIETLAQSYACHDLAGMFDGLRKTLSEQIDKTREHGGEKYWDLMAKLERGHTQIQKLQTFISITMRHIGRMEGQAKASGQIRFTEVESRDVIVAAENYQNALQG